VASVLSNIGLLAFFKYFNFATENYDALVAWLGLPDLQLEVAFRVTLPLGISFYTFQSLSYTIDVYRGRATAIRSLVDFACYVSMFPQLVAGPIVRFTEVADQLRTRTHTITKFARGAAFFSLGLAKKVLLANPCGKVADLAFDAGGLTVVDAWYGVIAYAFQIYFDFSGYSDMAIGLGLMLGFVFPKNFDSPYRSQSITEFWHRWHISLSTWLRDYLYVPLGGNRKGPRRTYVNLAIVMLLGGLWHGAAWNFVVWGGLHGLLLAVERFRGKASFYAGVPAPLRVALTFAVVLVTWVFFRAPDLPSAMRYLGHMAGIVAAHDGAPLLAGVVYQPYYFGTMLVSGTGDVGRAPDVGLEPHADAGEGRNRARVVRGGSRRAVDAGLQSVHLFHLLMSQSLPSGHPPTREEIARIEVGHTTVSPGTARWLVLIFLVLVTIPLVVDAGARVSGRADVSTAWPELRGLRGEVQRRLAGHAGCRRRAHHRRQPGRARASSRL
jgi:alginate O-acetyltransferase complex protein AlgI